ncbi:MAG: hypothetical protein KAR31_02275, partial [Candidatus Omnitrophica bacterium]|nr:hypothetical protein [Candidatus Omnitrophota bacterium]
GNDTIDPYPLIPREAAKILCVTQQTFLWIEKSYQTFHRGMQSAKKALNTKRLRQPFSSPGRPSPTKHHFLTYEPSNAIYTNSSDYRRWCRVTEWFNQFGPDAEKNERKILDQIKMDT